MEDQGIARSTMSRQEEAELRSALEQSVRLQSHYAGLLNVYDGGRRLQFATAGEWMTRLSSLKAPPMKIRTEFVYPPIPDRRWDWSAVDDDTYGGPGSPIGMGPTEEAAIADLMEQIES